VFEDFQRQILATLEVEARIDLLLEELLCPRLLLRRTEDLSVHVLPNTDKNELADPHYTSSS
jgi:hypothetical protein